MSAISDMVAPVVLMTLGTIFANGLNTVAAAIADSMFALNRERLAILRGPQGEILDEDSLPPIDRERLAQIRDQLPVMISRVRRLGSAVLIIWIAVGLLVLSVAAIAVAVTANSEAFAFTALALVMAGVTGVFAGIATVIAPAPRAANAVIAASSETPYVLRITRHEHGWDRNLLAGGDNFVSVADCQARNPRAEPSPATWHLPSGSARPNASGALNADDQQRRTTDSLGPKLLLTPKRNSSRPAVLSGHHRRG